MSCIMKCVLLSIFRVAKKEGRVLNINEIITLTFIPVIIHKRNAQTCKVYLKYVLNSVFFSIFFCRCARELRVKPHKVLVNCSREMLNNSRNLHLKTGISKCVFELLQKRKQIMFELIQITWAQHRTVAINQ